MGRYNNLCKAADNVALLRWPLTYGVVWAHTLSRRPTDEWFLRGKSRG
jgi:hypothetical protein